MALTNNEQLLVTKLFIPTIRSQLVKRDRLLELLQQGIERKLTLICAPAGFGKTTLAAQWHHAHPHQPLAWVSLDAADNEPLRFVRYLVAAFRELLPDQCDAILAQLNGTNLAVIEAILTDLINGLTSLIARQNLGRLSLVLDDYHLIQNEVVANAVTFLVDHMPPELHLIITSRVDPLLPLSRLRARDQLIEIRASELRFQVEETVTFVEQSSNLRAALALEDITQLTARTEGWVVGLQLALLWLKGRENKAEVLEKFTGNNRFVLEYLAEEVLNHQPEPVQTFLLQTSLLDRFNATLANAVTGLNWDAEDLHRLEQANLFLVPLDDEGEWYRYHHLFAEFLQHRLKREAPQKLGGLHLRASLWLEQHGLQHEAIEHALVASDFHRAARLLEPIAWPLMLRGEHFMLNNWMAKIPEKIKYDYPELCLVTCYVLLLKGHLAGYEKLFQAAEQGLKSLGEPTKLLQLLEFQVYFARCQNNLEATFRYAEQALELVPPGDIHSRIMIEMAKIQVYLNHGEVNKALNCFNTFLTQSQQKENIYTGFIATFSLATLYLLQGDLQAALKTFQENLKLDPDSPKFSVITYRRIGSIYLEQNEIELAESYLRLTEKLERQLGENLYGSVGSTMYGGLWWPDGDQLPVINWTSATNEQIEQYWLNNLVAQMKAFRNRFGRKMEESLPELEKWCQITFPGGYTALSRPLEYQREPQYLSLARVLKHQHRFEEALLLLEELRQFAHNQGRTHNLIKILILLALTYHAASNAQKGKNIVTSLALDSLREALVLAEPGGYIKVFLEEGEALHQLLLQLWLSLDKEDRKLDEYLRKLLMAFGDEKAQESRSLEGQINKTGESQPQAIDNNHNLFEPLTERELEVLRLIANGASNQEIASKLVVSINTIKKHTSSIFDKLEVRSRTQVLLRAQDLGLI